MTNPDNVGGLPSFVPAPKDFQGDELHRKFVAGWNGCRAELIDNLELCRAAPAGGEPNGKLVGWWNGITPGFDGMGMPSIRWGADAEDSRHDIPLYDGYNPIHYVTPVSAPAGSGEVDDAEALREFTEYFVKNYPGPHTVIMDPNWHAPRIFRAAKRALLRKLQQGADGEARDGRRWRAVRDSQALEDDAIRLTTWSPHLQEPLYPSPVMADRLADELIASQDQEGGHAAVAVL